MTFLAESGTVWVAPKGCTAGQVYQYFPGKMAQTQPWILSRGEREAEEWLPSAGVSPASSFWGGDSTCLLPVRHHLLFQWQLPGWRRRDGTLIGDRLPSLRGRGLSTMATVLRTGHPTSHRFCEYRAFKASLSISQVGGWGLALSPCPIRATLSQVHQVLAFLLCLRRTHLGNLWAQTSSPS